MTTVPHVNDMEDDILKKHINARHVGTDFLMSYSDLDVAPGVLDPARIAHDYWHRTNPDAYDHDHLEETR